MFALRTTQSKSGLLDTEAHKNSIKVSPKTSPVIKESEQEQYADGTYLSAMNYFL